MTGFVAGMATGCLVGVTATVVLLLFAAVWFGERGKPVVEPSLRGIAVACTIVLALAGLGYALHLPRAAVMMLFLAVVFLIADQLEVLTALIASALSAITMIFLFLPPLRSIRVVHFEDRLSLAIFVLISVVGCRLIGGRRSEAVAEIRVRPSVEAGD